MWWRNFFKNEPPRSRVGYTVLFYLPCLFALSLVFIFSTFFAGVSSLWSIVGLKMFSSSLYIYGPAEKYCIRSVMVCSAARLAAPFLLGTHFWSLFDSWAWPASLYGALEIVGGITTTFVYSTESLSSTMTNKLRERTALGGLDETVIMPPHTRIAVCLMAVLEWIVGLQCVLRPEFVEWITKTTPSENSTSFLAATSCYGTVTVITSTIMLVVVLVFQVAAIKWWIAAYHVNMALSILPLRFIFGIEFGVTFVICAFHFVAGLTITILPSALDAGGVLNQGLNAVEKSIGRAERKLLHAKKSIEERVGQVTGRDQQKKFL